MTTWFSPLGLNSKYQLAAHSNSVVTLVNVMTSAWIVYVNGKVKEEGRSDTPQGAKVQASRAATDYVLKTNGEKDADTNEGSSNYRWPVSRRLR